MRKEATKSAGNAKLTASLEILYLLVHLEIALSHTLCRTLGHLSTRHCVA